MADLDALYLRLKGAREKLCLACMECEDDVDRAFLNKAINNIDRVGMSNCPQWSRFDQPAPTS